MMNPIANPAGFCILRAEAFARYFEEFSALYEESVINEIPDRDAWKWLLGNVPLLDCSDPAIEETYYFRWWIYRKHLKRTPDGFVVTEFLPEVRHGGKHNTINCPVGHQFYEGRWIKDLLFLDEYGRFMLDGGGNLNAYTCWFADGVYQRYCVNRDAAHLTSLLPSLRNYYRKWEERGRDGLFFYTPWMDGMEYSISGNLDDRFRPTFNSYMYADALAIARVAELAGESAVAEEFQAKAAAIKAKIQEYLWHPGLEFFASRDLKGRFVPHDQPVREAIGFVPWYFRLPDAGYEAGWALFNDPQGFCTPIGQTSAEIRHPRFLKENPERLPTWDGPIWPFATSQTLTALQILLREYEQSHVTAADYMRELSKYAASHRRDGKPSVSEVIRDPYVAQMAGSEHYNHSTFCDLVITGAAGLVPRADDVLEIAPLISPASDYLCLDGVSYHGRLVSIVWDRTGERYGQQGFQVYLDGERRHSSENLKHVAILL